MKRKKRTAEEKVRGRKRCLHQRHSIMTSRLSDWIGCHWWCSTRRMERKKDAYTQERAAQKAAAAQEENIVPCKRARKIGLGNQVVKTAANVT